MRSRCFFFFSFFGRSSVDSEVEQVIHVQSCFMKGLSVGFSGVGGIWIGVLVGLDHELKVGRREFWAIRNGGTER
jgi:hypothetical protein